MILRLSTETLTHFFLTVDVGFIANSHQPSATPESSRGTTHVSRSVRNVFWVFQWNLIDIEVGCSVDQHILDYYGLNTITTRPEHWRSNGCRIFKNFNFRLLDSIITRDQDWNSNGELIIFLHTCGNLAHEYKPWVHLAQNSYLMVVQSRLPVRQITRYGNDINLSGQYKVEMTSSSHKFNAKTGHI